MPYINGKLQESTFQNFLRIINTHFGEEVMTILLAECQSARISDLDQNFCFEAQTTLASPWTSFEGFITLITAEKSEENEREHRGEEKKEKRGREEKRNQGEFDRSLGQSSFSSSPLFHLPWIL